MAEGSRGAGHEVRRGAGPVSRLTDVVHVLLTRDHVHPAPPALGGYLLLAVIENRIELTSFGKGLCPFITGIVPHCYLDNYRQDSIQVFV